MRLGMIVILDADGEPEIIATAGWATEAKGKPIETLRASSSTGWSQRRRRWSPRT